MRLLFFASLALLTLSCSQKNGTSNKFTDPILVKIADLKDRRASDSLYLFFKDDNAAHRLEAIIAFASLQDTGSVDNLAPLLRDADANVRKAAAFALGQTGGNRSAPILIDALNSEKDPAVLNAILEGIGKTADEWTPLAVDSRSHEGLAWGIYRLALRGKSNQITNALAASLLGPKSNDATRLAAAHYLARGAQGIESLFGMISRAALTDSLVEVRMAAALALRKIPTDSSLLVIESILASDEDYRVKVNAMRALSAFRYERVENHLTEGLASKYPAIRIAASEIVLSLANEKAWVQLANLAEQVQDWRAQAKVYQAVLKQKDLPFIIDEIKSLYDKATDPYHRAALLSSLQEAPSAYPFVFDQLIKADTPVIRSSAAAALVAMNESPRFKASMKSKFADMYRRAISTGDPAVIGTVCGALANPSLGYREIISDASFLIEAKNRLSLPRDNEALQPLERAIAHFEGLPVANVLNEYNHPIDWALVRQIPSNATAIIRTSRGHIVIRLFVDEAPGSVANFVHLARTGYFDKKFFHRVVPNFVIQAGCNRGDGWGSEDYSIRSEFSERKYRTGSVGMASAGKDTEGTQWFITHSPTPHLDGRYNIFAEVDQGMEVVHQIQVGDRILGVDLPFLEENDTQ